MVSAESVLSLGLIVAESLLPCLVSVLYMCPSPIYMSIFVKKRVI